MAEDKNKPAKAEAAKADKFTVVSDFRDKTNFDKVFSKGDDVSHLDKARLQDLVTKGLVKKS